MKKVRQFKFQEFKGFVTRCNIFTFSNYKFDDSKPWKHNLEAIIYDFIEQDYSELTLINSNGYLFDNVMVMDKDEAIKENRLGLLKQIYSTMLTICDLSKIVYK